MRRAAGGRHLRRHSGNRIVPSADVARIVGNGSRADAVGGTKGGISHGATDELGYNAVEDIVHVHDLHAALLHQLGVDHKRLTYKFQGHDFRLTDVSGGDRKILG
jgi:hypothetical protein